MVEILKEIPLWLLVCFSVVIMVCFLYAVATGREVNLWGFKIGKESFDTDKDNKRNKEYNTAIEYIGDSISADLVEKAHSVEASTVYVCATSLGRTGKYISKFLDNTNLEIHVFCTPPKEPYLVPRNIKEAKGVLELLIGNYKNNNRLHIYTTDNPPSVGFLSFCDRNKNVQLCYLHWYTFRDGFSWQRGRGKNGTIVIKRGLRPDADLLLDRMKEIIAEKLEDSSLKTLTEYQHIIPNKANAADTKNRAAD